MKYSKELDTVLYSPCCNGQGTTAVTGCLGSSETYNKVDTVARVILTADDSIGCHVHSGEMEAYIILSGTGIFNDNGVEKQVGAMDVTITRSGEMHAIRPVPGSEKPLELIAVIVKE